MPAIPPADVARTLENTPAVLETLLRPIDDEALRIRPEPGEWAPLEVIGHLIACDSGAFRDRILTIVDGNQGGTDVIPPFDPWAAINDRDFKAESLSDLVAELRTERAISAELLRGLSSADLTMLGRFADDDRDFAADDFVYEWPFHDQDHLCQILACLKLTYLPHMTSSMRDALT